MDNVGYLFIDGGYFRLRHKESLESLFGAGVGGEIDYAMIRTALSCAKAFYYDCLDEQKPGEPPADFGVRRRAQEESFNRIREVPGFHVRTGTLSNRRQKEVDVALAVDLLTHAFYKNMTRAVLIAGDLDFRPVVDSLIRLGTYVEVASAKSATAKPLQWAADQHRELTFREFYEWSTAAFKTNHPIPHDTIGSTPNTVGWSTYWNGRLDGKILKFLGNGDHSMIVVYEYMGQATLTVKFSGDRDLMERWFEATYGRVAWT